MSPDPTKNPKWIGYELHDGLLQWVVGARMQLESVASRTDDPELKKKLQQSLRMLKLALAEGRQLIGFLEQDESLGRVEFHDVLQQFVQSLDLLPSKQTIETVRSQPEWPELADSLTWNLLRIAQQAIMNAIQHSESSKITITTGWQDSNHLFVEVSDDGCGFTIPRSSQPGHFGMSSIQYRAQLIGAQLNVDSAPAAGCSIKVTFAI
jgi:signal transduction histidine kinase